MTTLLPEALAYASASIESRILFQAEASSLAIDMCRVEIIEGDLLDQEVDVIVNAWNRNIIPWWLLIPHGVSGAIKKRAGYEPFKELRRTGALPLGGAVLTGAGELPYRGIIHVAGINMLWWATETSIRKSVRNAIHLAESEGFRSMAFPLIGAGTGGMGADRSKTIMLDELSRHGAAITVKLVIFRKNKK